MSLEDLRRQISLEKNKQSQERKVSSQNNQERHLKKELFMLKHRKAIGVIKMFGSGAKRTGQGLGTMLGKAKKNKALNNWARGFQ